jgi:hypothetical protein
MADIHEVYLLCRCDDIEQCVTERYIADVRIARTEIDDLRASLNKAQGEQRCGNLARLSA